MLNTKDGLSDPGDFEKPFRDKLTDLDGVPPSESWDAIQTALDQGRGLDRRWFVLILLLLVGSGGFIGGYWVSQRQVEREQASVGRFQIPDSQSAAVEQEVLLSRADRIEKCDERAGDDYDNGELVAGSHESVNEERIAGLMNDEGMGRTDRDGSGVGGARDSSMALVRDAEAYMLRNNPVNRRGDAGIEKRRDRGADRSTGKFTAESERRQDHDAGSEAGQIQHADTVNLSGEKLPVPEQLLVTATTSNGVAHQENGTLMSEADVVQKDDPSAPKNTLPADEQRATTDQAKALAHRGADASDSSVQVVHGPMRPPHPQYDDGIPLITAVGADLAKTADEVAQVPTPEAADSVDRKKEDPTPGKWVLQLSVGGNYVFKKLTPAEDLYYVTDLTNKNKFSLSNAGYNLAARVRRQMGAKTTLMAGLSWSRWQTYIGYNYYDVVADSVEVKQVTANSIEVSTYFRTRTNDIRTTVQQVGLSVGVLRQVQVLQRSHAVLLEASLYQKIYTSTRSNPAGHTAQVRPTHLAIRAGVERTIDIGNWRFTLTPYVQRYMGSLYTSESVFQFNPLQVGLDVGMLLPLQKK
jgi:hypothetical protein